MARLILIAVVLCLAVGYTSADEEVNTDLLKRLITELQKKETADAEENIAAAVPDTEVSTEENIAAADLEEEVNTEERQIGISGGCPGAGVKAFLFELNQFVFNKVPLYGWKRCNRPGARSNCGVNGFCCRHPFGSNVCYKVRYLSDNSVRLQ